jgi:hypothetical protein
MQRTAWCLNAACLEKSAKCLHAVAVPLYKEASLDDAVTCVSVLSTGVQQHSLFVISKRLQKTLNKRKGFLTRC